MRPFAFAFLTIALLGDAALAAPLPPLVERAFSFMEQTRIDDWNYTVTSRDSDGTLVERHVASRPERSRWQLLSKDGEAPTADDLDDYEKVRARRERERVEREKQTENILESMVEPGSVVLVSETEARATYQFRMNGKHAKAGKFAEQLRGVMVVDKKVPFVELAELHNVDDLRAATGVKIAGFEMVLRWTRNEATGAVVPSSIHTRIEGRAFLVKKIDEDSTVVFSEFVPSDRIRRNEAASRQQAD